jgi:hypothetical protein
MFYRKKIQNNNNITASTPNNICTILNNNITFLPYPNEFYKCILTLKDKFQLQNKQIAQLIYPIAYYTSTRQYKKMWYEMQQWMVLKQFPNVTHFGLYLVQLCNLNENKQTSNKIHLTNCQVIESVLEEYDLKHTQAKAKHVRTVHRYWICVEVTR